MKRFLIATLILSFCGFTFAEDKGWDHYKAILDKGMFPKVPDTPPPPPPQERVKPPAPKWEIDYKITTVYEHFKSGEVMVGIQNIKNQRNMLLRAGQTDSNENLTVEKVMSDDGPGPIQVELSKSGEVHTFDFATSVAAFSAAPKARSTGRSVTPPRTSSRGPIRPSGSSYFKGRPSQTTGAQPSKLNGEQIEKHLIQYQKEVIKKGLPLLPVGLPDKDIKELEKSGFIQRQPNGR